jgi:nitronate monooxygenase
MHTPLTRALGIELPIIQAPMAGANATPPALVAAVSNAGGLGFIGAAYMSPDEIAEQAAAVRRLTARPFGINLFAPLDAPSANADGGRVSAPDPGAAIARLRGYHEELGLPAPAAPSPPRVRFDEQFEAVVRSGARAFSFTFNALASEHIAGARSRGLYVMGTATTVNEALILVERGVDAVVAQGSEAGGHRGTFAAPFEMAMIGTMALVPQVVDAVPVPVVASGGIMDGRGIAAALALGASAVQMGTAFLTCEECGAASSYKDLITQTPAESTRLTRAFSGRPARGIVNRVMREIEFAADAGAILPYPDQNSLTRAMRSAAAAQDRTEYLSLWAGQGAPLARRQSAAALMQRLSNGLDAARAALTDDV